MQAKAKAKVRFSKTTAYGVVGLLAAATLAGCGAGDDSGSDARSGDTKTDSTTRRTAERSPSQVVRATNEKTSKAGSARLEITSTVSAGGETQKITGKGVIDLGDGTSKLTLGKPGQRIEQRIVDQVLYQKPPKGEAGLPGGKSWMKIDLKTLRASGASGGDQVSDPSDSFAYSKSLSEKDVKKVGQEYIGGVKTTHYRVSVDIDKLARGDEKEAEKLREQLGETVPMDLWIDTEGLTRRQQMELKAPSDKRPGKSSDKSSDKTGKAAGAAGMKKATVVMDFSDFGTDVAVDAPAAADTADMTDKVVAQGRQKA
ncbi:hypothetical protein [Streptomyces sp. NPDC047123]|uniref:hypothetical protein n=1 Tax=Streptomyces sp. NPDC047123 TaxID=3155622 RepID=UPI0033D674AE